MPEVDPADATPDVVQRLARGGSQLRYGADTVGDQPGFHFLSDAAEIPELQTMQAVGKVRLLDHEKAVGFGHV